MILNKGISRVDGCCIKSPAHVKKQGCVMVIKYI